VSAKKTYLGPPYLLPMRIVVAIETDMETGDTRKTMLAAIISNLSKHIPGLD
jgi:hypothetical protein